MHLPLWNSLLMTLGVELPWWVLLLIGVGGMIAFIPAILLVIGISEAVDSLKRRIRRRARAGRPSLAYPYYLDEAGLRSLAVSLKIELPISRQVTRSMRISALSHGLGGERGRTETAEFAAGLDLNRLAEQIDERLGEDKVATGLSATPYVRDEEVLAEAASRIEKSLGETSRTRELLERLRAAYDTEKLETVASQKREELRDAAHHSKLILVRGSFDRVVDPSAGPTETLLALTHLDALRPTRRFRRVIHEIDGDPRIFEYEPIRIPPLEPDDARTATPMPAGVGIRVVLPDAAAFTAAGKERIGRGEPFYARVIAHSPSFDNESGVLTCSAYAVWGIPAP